MSDNEVFPVQSEWAARAWADEARYRVMYRRSVGDPEESWGEEGKRLDWMRPYTKVKDASFAGDDLHIRWFQDGTLNACYNCVDRHLKTHGDQMAIIWEGDSPELCRKITYHQLRAEVGNFAQGDRSDREPRPDSVGTILAEDALRQDHATHP